MTDDSTDSSGPEPHAEARSDRRTPPPERDTEDQADNETDIAEKFTSESLFDTPTQEDTTGQPISSSNESSPGSSDGDTASDSSRERTNSQQSMEETEDVNSSPTISDIASQVSVQTSERDSGSAPERNSTPSTADRSQPPAGSSETNTVSASPTETATSHPAASNTTVEEPARRAPVHEADADTFTTGLCQETLRNRIHHRLTIHPPGAFEFLKDGLTALVTAPFRLVIATISLCLYAVFRLLPVVALVTYCSGIAFAAYSLTLPIGPVTHVGYITLALVGAYSTGYAIMWVFSFIDENS